MRQPAALRADLRAGFRRSGLFLWLRGFFVAGLGGSVGGGGEEGGAELLVVREEEEFPARGDRGHGKFDADGAVRGGVELRLEECGFVKACASGDGGEAGESEYAVGAYDAGVGQASAGGRLGRAGFVEIILGVTEIDA